VIRKQAFENGRDYLSKTFNEVNECLHEGILSQNSKVVLRTSCLTKNGNTRSYSHLVIFIIEAMKAIILGLFAARGIESIKDRYLRSLDKNQLKQPNMEMVSGGTFLMGSDMGPYSSPIHEFIITYDFYLTIKSIAFAEYVTFCDSTGRKEPMMYALERQNAAVVRITWYDSIDYCNWLSDNEDFQKLTISKEIFWMCMGIRQVTHRKYLDIDYLLRQNGNLLQREDS